MAAHISKWEILSNGLKKERNENWAMNFQEILNGGGLTFQELTPRYISVKDSVLNVLSGMGAFSSLSVIHCIGL